MIAGGSGGNTSLIRSAGFAKCPCPTAKAAHIAPALDLPAGTYAITDSGSGNAGVTHIGGGVYRIAKTGGVDGAFDASAVSSAGAAGDFLLRITFVQGTPSEQSGWYGVNSDPLTDDNYASGDYGAIYIPGGGWFIYESGFSSTIFGGGPDLWIRRTGTTLDYLSGPDLNTATIQRTVTGVSSTLYFDSSLQDTSAIAEVQFYDVAVNNSIVAASGLSFAASATATGTGPLTATSTLTLAPSATMTGFGSVSGSSTLALAGSGNVVGKGAVTGASSLTFALSATVSGKGQITGASTITFAAASAVAGIGALTGSSALTVTTAGSVTGKAQVTGTTALAFAPGATMAGFGSVTASTSLALSANGSVTGLANVTGTTALTIAASGLLHDDAIAGTTTLAFAPTGTLIGVVPITGIAGSLPFQLTLSGTLISKWWALVEPATEAWANDNPSAGEWAVIDPQASDFNEEAETATTWTRIPRAEGAWN